MVSLRQGKKIWNRGDVGEEGLVEDTLFQTQSAVLTAEKTHITAHGQGPH